jgi:hypothetical protein
LSLVELGVNVDQLAWETISGKVIAYAALNSRNAGFSIIVTRLLGSITRN